MELAVEMFQEMKRPGMWVVFSPGIQEGLFLFVCFSFSQELRLETGPECFLPRVRHRGTAELSVSIFSFGCFTAFLSLSFSHWETRREGGLASVGVMEVKCRCGDVLLLVPNMTILNSHLGDLCKLAFSQDSGIDYLKESLLGKKSHKQECNGESIRV